MGIGPGRRCTSSPYAAPNSNPNPARFTIEKWESYANALVVLVHYPDASNFEGRKIMVYEGITHTEELRKRTRNRLDPHFAAASVSPVARFVPTDKGWSWACAFANGL